MSDRQSDRQVDEDPVTKPTSREAVGLTIILLLEVFVFMAAVFGIALTDAANARATTLALTTVKTLGEERATFERIGTLVATLHGAGLRAADPATRDELQKAAIRFGDTLGALSNGGEVTAADGTTTTIDAIKGTEQVKTLGSVTGRWTNVNGALSGDGAFGTFATERPTIDDGLRSLATTFETSGAATNDVRNWIFRLAILMVLAMVVTLFQRVSNSRRQLEHYAENLEHRTAEAVESTRALADAKAGTDLIMETVDRGLFLLDRDYKIQGQYSRELERMFRMPELEGYNFVNLLQRLLTERTFEISRDYLALLFDKKKKERTVLRVNPLAEIEVHFANPAGGFDSKFLNFTFRRIVDGDQVARVFVAVSEITDRVRLERQLRESEARKERQFEFLLGVLHVAPANLDDFLKTANEQVAIMNDALRASDFATNTAGRMELLRQRLDVVYRAVHTIKGNASSLELNYFEKTCDIFEGKIVQLRERSALGGDDFLSVVIAQSELRQDLDELQDLRERFVGLGRASVVKRESIAAAKPEPSDVVASIGHFASQLASKHHKEVAVDAPGFSTAALPDDLRRTVRDVLVQLTRNSVVHGIEIASARMSIGKAPAGTITIRPIKDAPAGIFGFSFRDDGQGLDPQLIRDKAVSKHVITPEQAAAMSDQQLVALIFKPTFSTLDESTSDGGRGIGMNVIKEAVVDKCGGKLSMSSEPGKYTEFTFMLPVANVPAAPASSNGSATLAYN